jgi:hypothetical protein
MIYIAPHKFAALQLAIAHQYIRLISDMSIWRQGRPGVEGSVGCDRWWSLFYRFRYEAGHQSYIHNQTNAIITAGVNLADWCTQTMLLLLLFNSVIFS